MTERQRGPGKARKTGSRASSGRGGRAKPDLREGVFKQLLEAAPDAIVVVDADGVIRLVNRQVEKMFGYARGELLGQPVEMLVPDHAKAIHPHHRAVYARDPRTRRMGAGLELAARCKDGTEFPADISLSAISTDEGLLVSAALRDVTERKRADERNRLAAIVESSSDAIVGKTLDGRITSWNAAAERLYGYSAEQAIGRNVVMIYPPERRDELEQTLARLRAGEPTLGLETIRLRRDGTRVDVLVSISPVRDDKGAIAGAASIERDITERVAAAKQQERLEAELQQAQRLESVGQLAGGIAHDFNNLIAVITNYATFVSDELGDRPELRDDVEEIRRAAERAAALTRQLLIFSRREVPHPEVLDLNSVVADMRKLLERTIGEHIELVTRTAPGLWPVLADRGQIEQVLMNLAVNSRDAMPKGGRLVIETANADLDDDYVSTRADLTAGKYVRLALADTGEGMTKEIADRAFEPFFTTKPKGQGTGLGLATVYGIAAQAGGKASIYSESGRGTTVSVHLPVAAGALPVTGVPLGALDLRGSGETILLVEDDAAVRVAARRILSQRGYLVLEADGPAAAIAVCVDRSRHIDLVLTDVVMPGISGIELARQLRRERPALRVLFISGYPQEVLAHQGIVPSDVDLVEKPFTRDDLLRAVRSVLEGPE